MPWKRSRAETMVKEATFALSLIAMAASPALAVNYRAWTAPRIASTLDGAE
jgi:hypothetical protein